MTERLSPEKPIQGATNAAPRATPSRAQAEPAALQAGTAGPVETADILIVGGGFCGSTLAVQLQRQAFQTGGPVPRLPRIVLVEQHARAGRGLAYGPTDTQPLLNAPAGNMSALADQPQDFMAYARQRIGACEGSDFLPRALYGDYLQQLLAGAVEQAAGRISVVHAQALTLAPPADADPAVPHPQRGWTLGCADGRTIQARQVVLALGHAPAADPLPAPGLAALGHRAVSAWDLAALDRLAATLPADSPVAILGSGHSAIDATLRLAKASPERPLWLFSRRGLLPQAHRVQGRPPAAATVGLPWLPAEPLRLHRLMRALRGAARDSVAPGSAGDWRDVLNELRPHLPALWHALPPAQRARFVRHALPWWDAHRHRLAPQAAQALQALREAGRVRPVAARLLAAEPVADGAVLHWRPRGQPDGTRQPVAARFGAVVHATGPHSDLARSPWPLVQQLHAAGLLQPDPLRLGLAIDDRYQPLGPNGQPAAGLYYLGPWLRARDWEAVAVPELREHVARLASQLLQP